MRLLFLILIIPTIIFCESKEYVILHARPGAGMFSIWMDVLSLLNEYEKGNYAGIEVNLDGGAYLDPNHGDNWWEYYCEPIRLGESYNPHHVIGNPPGSHGWIEKHLTRQQAYDLIKKHIHLKPQVSDKIDDFVKSNFEGYYIVSVHYRGTDKITEAPFVPYENVSKEVDKTFLNIKRPCKIFLATDDFAFLDYMIKRYGSCLCFTDSIRTNGTVGLHHSIEHKYKIGLEAIIDMILLSKGNYLIRTSSNLSRWSTWFNPKMPVKEMNQLSF